MSEARTGELWTRREYVLACAWFGLSVVLLAVPFFMPEGSAVTPATSREVLRPVFWAIGGGLLGAVLSILSIQMVQQSLKPRVQRGLIFEPPVGALVGFFVFLAAKIGVVSTTLGAADAPEFYKVVLLGGVSGFAWDVVLSWARARIEDVKSGT